MEQKVNDILKMGSEVAASKKLVAVGHLKEGETPPPAAQPGKFLYLFSIIQY